ncbi:uncharacterized abhydrolase domain-containing protein DDB_G0269086-like [Olea europaea var. sylvestris]|uniref:uncharacterized abhydrolase domain-containing protein DDB_G0269086-like n=1 Tax=Olea europaea var. sylvestris TaxID=158386 RepID=UPI000C1D4FC7|nr:uncharacterized abhydrolase domain-containing protein DDB_G0269086-like [Olea europaea var. sylvestris]
MASEGSSGMGRSLEIVRVDEPIVATSSEIAGAIMGGENMWKRPDSPPDTSVHWGASDYSSKLREADLGRLRTEYRIPDSVDLILPGPEERACYPRSGCVAISEAILRAGLRLPIHPFFRLVLRSYGLAPTQLNPNSWSQMEWKSSWCWAAGRWDTMEGDPLAPLTVPAKFSTLSSLPRCELSTEDFDIICVIYQLPQKKRSYHRLIRKNIHFVTHELMASQDNFNKKLPVRPDFKTIQKMMAEARALKASSSSYKKQMEELVEASKRLQPPTEEEVQEDPAADLRRKGKKSAAPPRRPTVARPPPVMRQTTILTGVALPERSPSAAEPVAAQDTTPLTAVPIEHVPGQQRRKRARSSKEVDFLGTSSEEPVREVLEALPPETAAVAVVHSKYWTEEWRDHTASCTAEDLVAVNSACVARALSTSIQLEGLVKDLNSKREDLAKRLEEAMHYGDAVRAAQAKAAKAEEAKRAAEVQLAASQAEVERLKKELYEVECQGAVVTRRLDHANEHHKLATDALEASNREKAELKQQAEAQSVEIASLREELKSAGEVAVQNFIDHFEDHPLYDDFANFWASWNAQSLLGRLKEVHPTLDISQLEEEFGGPAGGRPDKVTEEVPEAQEAASAEVPPSD